MPLDTPKWDDIKSSPQFLALPDPVREQIRGAYFQDFVEPSLSVDQITSARSEWDSLTKLAPQPPPRSTLGEIGNQAVASARVELPKMIGQAMQYMSEPGNTVYEAGKSVRAFGEDAAAGYEPQPERHGLITNTLAAGARMLAPSVGVGVATAAALSPLGLAAGGEFAIPALLTGAAFGASQAQETLEKGQKAGLSDELARETARTTGLIEAGGEALGTYFGYKLFGLAGKALFGEKTVQGAITGAVETGAWKPFVKQLPGTVAVEAGTEYGQNYGEAAVEQAAGIPQDQTPHEAGVQGFAAALGMTALLAPFGLAGFVSIARRNAKVAGALQDPEADPVQRAAASTIIYDRIKDVNPEAAASWEANSAFAVANKLPVILDESFAQPNALGQDITPPPGGTPEQTPTTDTLVANIANPDVGLDDFIAETARATGTLQTGGLIGSDVGKAIGEAAAALPDQELQDFAVSEQRDKEFMQAQMDRAKQPSIAGGTMPEAPAPTQMEIKLREAQQAAQERAQRDDQIKAEREAADAALAQQEAADTARQAKLPRPEELPILENVIKRKPVADEDLAGVLAKGFVRQRDDGRVSITEAGYRARNALRRQLEAPSTQQSEATPAPAPVQSEVTAAPAAASAAETQPEPRQTAPGEALPAAVTTTSPQASPAQGDTAAQATVEPKQEFASTQTPLPDPISARVKSVAKNLIAPADVDQEHGLEDRPHITVKYGLHTADVEGVRKLVEGEPPARAKVTGVEIFSPEGKDYDVVVARIDSPDLTRLNKKISDALPNTQTHPGYKPHITLGYVKRGLGEKYANAKTGLEGTEITLDTIEVSDQNENLTPIKLAGQPITSQAQPVAQATATSPASVEPQQAPAQPAAALEPWQMTREQYAQSRERAYVEKRGGQVPAKAAQSVNMAADRQHGRLVREAVAAGKPVPATVLADYPDLLAAQPNPEASDAGVAPRQGGGGAESGLAGHDALIERAREGNVTPDDMRVGFERVIAGKPELTAELSTLTKKELVTRIGSMGSRESDSKESLVKSAYRDVLSDFSLSEGISYNPMDKDGFLNAVRAKVEAMTEQDITDFAKRVADLRAERKERIAGFMNPQTLADFDLFSRVRGEDKLTPEQLARYDELLAAQGRARKAVEQERKATIQAAGVTVGAKIVETKHTQKGHDLFVVQLERRVERDEYLKLNTAAKKLGGYYSAFKGRGAVPGFQFKARTEAEAFQKLASEGDTQAATDAALNRREGKQGQKQDNAVTRLRDMADKLDEAADESLGRDRLANTAKRARQASSADADANANKALAKTMRSLSDAIESGEATHLERLRTKVQVEMLSAMANDARTTAVRKTSSDNYEKISQVAPTPEHMAAADFPDFDIRKGQLFNVVRDLASRPGSTLLANRLRKLAEAAANDDTPIAVTRKDAELALEKFGASRDAPWQWQSAHEKLTRLESMGITTLPELRAALREFVQYRASQPKADRIKELERGLAGMGKNVGIDFFPTPSAAAERVVKMADIQPGMRVLEPSAGSGNLADAVRAAQPDALVDTVEQSSTLRKILEAKGYALVGSDFMDMQSAESYDRIVMNPPFSNSMDADHVRHAYDMLKPGGRLISITGEGIFFRNDAKAREFREWLDRVGGTSEKLPEGTFTDRREVNTTGAASRVITIDKPGETDNALRLSRTEPAKQSIAARDLQTVVDTAKRNFKNLPEISILETPQDAPDSLKSAMGDAESADKIEAAFHDGVIYMFRSKLASMERAEHVLLSHELRHYGLRGTLGPSLDPVLRNLYLRNRALRDRANEIRKKYKLSSVAEATEEALVETPQSELVRLTGWRKFVLAVRDALRAMGFDKLAGAVDAHLKDTYGSEQTSAIEITRILAVAEEWVRSGKTPPESWMSGTRFGDVASNPDRFSRSSPEASGPVSGFVGSLLQSSGKLGVLNGIATQYHKALMLARKGMPEFKAVFDRTQAYLNDITSIAVSAEQMAPSIFRELRGMGLGSIKQYFKGAATDADIAATQPALHVGTLWGGGNPMEGRKWTNEELKFGGAIIPAGGANLDKVPTSFKKEIKRVEGGEMRLANLFTPLNAKQIELYHQARATVDKSLEDQAKSIIHRQVRGKGIEFDKGMSLEDAAQVAQDGLNEQINALNEKMGLLHDQANEAEPGKGRDDIQKLIDKAETDKAELVTLKSTVEKIELKANGLIQHAYMPLMRFGNRVVRAVDKDGKVQFVGFYDGNPLIPKSADVDMNRAAMTLRSMEPTWTVTTERKSERAWELYSGLNLDALENFLDFLDPETKANLERDKTIQEYLQNAVNSRSTLTRMVHRKGTPGFSTDIPRTLASFITSNARSAAGNYHAGAMKSLVEDIQQGDIKDEAADLVKYILEPQEEAAKLRSFLFFHFLGGSIAAGLVNLSQTPMMTAPALLAHAGAAKVTSAITAAAKNAGRDPATIGGEMGKALQKAEQEGVTAPQMVYHLTAVASNNPFSGNRHFRTFMAMWGGMFSATEVFNRRVAFMAAYEIAAADKTKGDAYEFAKGIVADTQLLYNKGNRPNLGRGALGATVLTFKTFTLGYLELLRRLPPKQQLMMLGMLVLMAGAEGLPFAEDIEDLVDSLGQALGFTTNTHKWLGKTIRENLGPEWERPLLHGLGGMLPIALHSRLGFGNIIPATSYFKASEIDKTRDVAEAVGPVGSVLKSFSDSLQMLARGRWDAAAVNAAPKAVRDAYNGAHMLATGEAEDTKGRKTLADVTLGEAAGKAIGFNPQRAAQESEVKREIMQDKNLRTVRMDEIAGDWADGILRKDAEKQADARERFRQWNRDNPDLRIAGSSMMRSVQERVRAARLTSEQRFLKSVPKQMREGARQEFQR